MGDYWLFQQNIAGLEAFTELQKANMMAEFAVGLAKKEMEQGPSVLSEWRRQQAMETVRGWSDGLAPELFSNLPRFAAVATSSS